MEIRLLGMVEAEIDGRLVDLGPRQQRLVFAVLALAANRLVPIDRLIELVWPESVPRTAAHAIRVCVSRLRSALTADGSDPALVTRGSGYLLRVDPARIDAYCFETLVAQAREAGDDREMVALLDCALALWRAPALADTASPAVRDRLCAALDETRLTAVEDRLDALLRLGRHREAVAELTVLVDAHPGRERAVGLLMLALHYGGRTAQALDLYRRTRTLLAEELGLDPGSELRQIEMALLRDDPAVRAPGVPAVAAPVAASAVAAPAPAAALAAVPAQLPPSVADFTGRASHLLELDGLLAAPGTAPGSGTEPKSGSVSAGGAGSGAAPGAAMGLPGIVVIAGTAGAGKTALAVRWAHRVRDRFPDGQLHIDLRGFSPSPSLTAEQALVRFLRALGVRPEEVPVDTDEATAVYRTLLADRRVLIVLDNAADPEQVRPLLPGSPGCLTVVTSRDRLDGLAARDGARRLTLGVLSVEEADALLGAVLGAERVAAEPAAARELAVLCARLPLALRITAAHLTNHPGRRVADHLAELRGGDLLDELEIAGDTDTAVGAAFGVSYRALEPAAQRLFRLLGPAPGPDITAAAAARLADLPPGRAARLLDRLAAAHLLEQHVPGRYTTHDLLRRYAADRARDEERGDDLRAAEARLLGYYLPRASHAADLLYPYMLRLPTAPEVGLPGAGSSGAGLSEAGSSGAGSSGAGLSEAGSSGAGSSEPGSSGAGSSGAGSPEAGLSGAGSSGADGAEIGFSGAGSSAADASGPGSPSPASSGAAPSGPNSPAPNSPTPNSSAPGSPAPGSSEDGFDSHADALAWFDAELPNLLAAVRLAAAGTSRRTAWLLADTMRGYFYLRRGYLDWLETAHIALGAAEADDDPQARAAAHFSLGTAYFSRNRYPQAVEHYTAAEALSGRAGWRLGEAAVLTNLGLIDEDLGALASAADRYRRALGLYRQAGARHIEAVALVNLGSVEEQRGRLRPTVEYSRRALAISRELGSRRGEADALYYLGAALGQLGDTDEALGHLTRVVEIYRELGARNDEAVTLVRLADVLRDAGHVERALREARTALNLARETGERRTEAAAGHALAATLLAAGDPAAAADAFDEALRTAVEIGARYETCQALTGLALIEAGRGRPGQAVAYAQRALAMARHVGYELLESRARAVLDGIAAPVHGI